MFKKFKGMFALNEYRPNKKHKTVLSPRLGSVIQILDSLCEREGNFCFSPLSLYEDLVMVRSLESEDSESQEVRKLTQGFNSSAYEYSEGFSHIPMIWLDSSKSVNTSIIPEDLPYRLVNMANNIKATEEKDRFVSESTHGFINNTPVKFTVETYLDVMSILYFNKRWSDFISVVENKSGFISEDGSVSYPRMLGKTGSSFLRGKHSSVFKLHYSNGLEFWAIKPDGNPLSFKFSDLHIQDFLDQGEGYTRIDYYTVQADKLEVDFKMPEFSISSFINLSEITNLVNIKLDPRLFGEHVNIGSVTQVNKIVVDKEGTKAASVTEATAKFGMRRLGSTKKVNFHCTSPFAYLIYDTVNEEIVYIGRVVNFPN